MNETDIDALVHKFSPEEWSVKIREGMNRLGLYFEGDEIKDERESRKASTGEAE